MSCCGCEARFFLFMHCKYRLSESGRVRRFILRPLEDQTHGQDAHEVSNRTMCQLILWGLLRLRLGNITNSVPSFRVRHTYLFAVDTPSLS